MSKMRLITFLTNLAGRRNISLLLYSLLANYPTLARCLFLAIIAFINLSKNARVLREYDMKNSIIRRSRLRSMFETFFCVGSGFFLFVCFSENTAQFTKIDFVEVNLPLLRRRDYLFRRDILPPCVSARFSNSSNVQIRDLVVPSSAFAPGLGSFVRYKR